LISWLLQERTLPTLPKSTLTLQQLVNLFFMYVSHERNDLQVTY
jgi:hypothetical protein